MNHIEKHNYLKAGYTEHLAYSRNAFIVSPLKAFSPTSFKRSPRPPLFFGLMASRKSDTVVISTFASFSCTLASSLSVQLGRALRSISRRRKPSSGTGTSTSPTRVMSMRWNLPPSLQKDLTWYLPGSVIFHCAVRFFHAIGAAFPFAISKPAGHLSLSMLNSSMWHFASESQCMSIGIHSVKVPASENSLVEWSSAVIGLS
mmetsp:Transcript_102777/g.187634  ORF Transcript_102777/g.187634 Transcript_102777/m.187634 type:complete len:202 (+) Transcript_102777:92-697(+)